MEINIPDAYRCPKSKGAKIMEAIASLKENFITTTSKWVYSTFAELLLQATGADGLPLIINKNLIQNRYDALIELFDQHTKNEEYVKTNFSAGILLIFHNNHIYILGRGINFLEDFHEVIEKEAQEFSYVPPKPDNLTESQWKSREKSWQDALTHGIKLNIDLTPEELGNEDCLYTNRLRWANMLAQSELEVNKTVKFENVHNNILELEKRNFFSN